MIISEDVAIFLGQIPFVMSNTHMACRTYQSTSLDSYTQFNGRLLTTAICHLKLKHLLSVRVSNHTKIGSKKHSQIYQNLEHCTCSAIIIVKFFDS